MGQSFSNHHIGPGEIPCAFHFRAEFRLQRSQILRSLGVSGIVNLPVLISYSKFGGETLKFRIPDMIDEFRVFCFIFEDGVEF